MIKQYTLTQIDQCDIGNIRIPDDPKYQELIKFLETKFRRNETVSRPLRNDTYKRNESRYKKESTYTIDRGSFGNKKSAEVPNVCLFGKTETLDGQIKCKINELNCKITEQNISTILKDFKQLSFGDVEDISDISSLLHRSILVCSKYGDQILELFEFLVKEHPRYLDPLRICFLKYNGNQFKALAQLGDHSDADLEEKYSIKRLLTINYELMVKCLKLGIIFDKDMVTETREFLLGLNDIEGLEILIRFYVCLKQHDTLFPIDDLKLLSETIKERNYPKRLVFLLMDLE